MVDSPYFLRSKRRRLNRAGEEGTSDYFAQENVARRRKNPIMHLPTELLIVLFKNLSYRDLGYYFNTSLRNIYTMFDFSGKRQRCKSEI